MVDKDFSDNILDVSTGNNSEEEYSYNQLPFTDFVEQYQNVLPTPRFFELSLPWLRATHDHMIQHESASSHIKVIVHCLFVKDSLEQPTLIIAWPLVHEGNTIRSLTSFYSAITEPMFISDNIEKNLLYLLGFIDLNNIWQQMQLGSFDENSITSKTIKKYFLAQKYFSQTDNYYLDNITHKLSDDNETSSFEHYYQQRPSQLRNTIKRREKKLTKEHHVDISIISKLGYSDECFNKAFDAYKSIYQQSWKGDEFSFDFIEQVCRDAMRDDKLRLGLLTVDNEPAAAQLWFLQSTKNARGVESTNASIFKLAYSPKYQQFSVGSLLSKALTEHVLNVDVVDSIEFGMGSEPYKKDWLPKKRVRVSYHVFNQRTLHGRLLALRYVFIPKLIKYIKPFRK